jgi:MazG family protein
LPALLHAQKTQKKAARVGFDWPDVEPVFAKLHEEISELRAALTAPATDLLSPISAIEDELGDLLFTVVNLARKLHLDAETALHRSTRKFSARFRAVEQLASARGITLEKLTLAELDQLWDEVKRQPAD